MADDGLLSEEVATHMLARKALERLDHVWPESSTLGLDDGADERAFRREIQYLVDRGLMQYELFMADDPPVYRYANRVAYWPKRASPATRTASRAAASNAPAFASHSRCS